MLVLPEVFQRTLGVTPEPFWPKATVAVRRANPAFIFLAEVYWDLEWALQQQGFNCCYDKRLSDRLQSNDVRSIREHLRAGLDYQDKLARFLENHDEFRAASTFQWPKHPAAAAITFLSPGLRFFHQSQLEGARVRVPAHLCRGPSEPTNQEVAAFDDKLLLITEGYQRVSERRLVSDRPAAGFARQVEFRGFRFFRLGGKGRRALRCGHKLQRRSRTVLSPSAIPRA